MPQTQLSNRLGTNNTIFDVDEKPRVPRSRFDLSRKNMTTIDIGGIYPVDFFRVFPNDDISLSVDYLLDTLPLAVPPMNNYRVRTHWYFCKMSSLWKGWESFVTKGRSGKIELEIPTVSARDLDAPDSQSRLLTVPMGLCQYLGLQAKYVSKQSSASTPVFLPYCQTLQAQQVANVNRLTTGYNILPFLMYQKIYRDNYAPVNLLSDNNVWFPDDLADEWRISYDADNVGSVGEEDEGLYFIPKGKISDVKSVVSNFVPSVEDTVVDLRMLRYACFENDYFTSAKPWLVRGGEEESLDLTVNLDSVSADFSSVFDKLYNDSLATFRNITSATANGSCGMIQPAQVDSSNFNQVMSNDPDRLVIRPPTFSTNSTTSFVAPDSSYARTVANLYTSLFNLAKLNGASAKASLTANLLRNMLAISVWQERNAVASGNYNALIRAHFNSSPKSPEWEPVYLGGTSDVVSFGQVLQTSQSTSESPLGSQAGLGSASGRSHVFKFSSHDYGYIMGVMIVSPEVIYTQGVDRLWTDVHQSDIFYPEYANLGYEPILNRELYVSGDEAVDNGLAGYQTRLAYLKQRRNVAGGLFSLPQGNDKLFSAYVQAREFDSLPKLSAEFVSMSPENVRRDWLSFTKQPAFKLQFASNLTVVRALPFQSTPNTFGF